MDMDGWMDGWIDGWMDGWMHGWMVLDGYGWLDGWIWMDRVTIALGHNSKGSH